MAPTNFERQAMETEIRREARFNIVSKTLFELKKREENHSKKFQNKNKDKTLKQFFSETITELNELREKDKEKLAKKKAEREQKERKERER